MPLYLHVCASLPLRACLALLDLRWDCQALFNQTNRLFESFEAVCRADMHHLSRSKNFHFGFEQAMLYIKNYDWVGMVYFSRCSMGLGPLCMYIRMLICSFGL